MSRVVLSCQNLSKSYVQGPVQVEVLSGIEFSVSAGQRVAIVGASGSGKSTLLNLLGGLDQPSAGEVFLHQQPFSSMSDNQRGELRNTHLGFVYQFHHLLGEFSARENVAMPCRIGGLSVRESFQRADDLLNRVGLSHRLHHKPGELSGGERQRVAIARALVMNPACVLMDEPTGNLDRQTAESIWLLMAELQNQYQTAFVVVTHDEVLASRTEAVFRLDSRNLTLIHAVDN